MRTTRPMPRFIFVGGWSAAHWLLLVAATLLLVSYFGLVSWGTVDEAIRRLAQQPSVRDAFQDPATGRLQALFVIFAFLLLTVPTVIVALFLVAFGVLILSAILGSIGSRIGVPAGAVKAAVLLGLAAITHAEHDVWLPWALRALGMVARAYLALTD